MRGNGLLCALTLLLGAVVSLQAQTADTIRISYKGDTVDVAPAVGGLSVQTSGAHVSVSLADSALPLVAVLSGESANGSLAINGNRPSVVVLDGLSLASQSGGAISLKGKPACTLLLAKDTENTLADAPGGEQKACLYSKATLTLAGSGGLSVQANCQHAVASKHSVRVADSAGVIDLTCIADGGKAIKANDSITIEGGCLTAMVSGNATIGEEDGVIDTTKAAALKADSAVIILGGQLQLTCTGTGSKCIVTDGTVTIGRYDGSGDDAAAWPIIVCRNTGLIFGDEPTTDIDTQCKPKAIKADGTITVNGGRISLYTSHEGGEGLESKTSVTINGGTILAECYDDCINTSGCIVMNEGFVRCVSNGNDAIDTNIRDLEAAALTLNGGVLLAFSAGGHHEEGIDVNRSAIHINGGYLLAIGGQQGGVEPKVRGSRTAAYLRGVDAVADRYYTLVAGDRALMTVLMPCNPTGRYALLAASGLLREQACRLEESLLPPLSAQHMQEQCFWTGTQPASATGSYAWTQTGRYVKADVACTPTGAGGVAEQGSLPLATSYHTLDGVRLQAPPCHGAYIRSVTDSEGNVHNKKIAR